MFVNDANNGIKHTITILEVGHEKAWIELSMGHRPVPRIWKGGGGGS